MAYDVMTIYIGCDRLRAANGFHSGGVILVFPASEAEVPSLLAEELGLDKPANTWPLPAAGGLDGVICLATVARDSDARSQP